LQARAIRQYNEKKYQMSGEAYYLDKGDKQEALKNFEKAKSLDSETHLIDQLLQAARL